MNFRTLLLAAWSATACLSAAEPAPEPERLNAIRLQEAWPKPITLTWDEKHFRAGAVRLGERLRIAVLIDRNLDPDVPVRLEARELPLAELWNRTAAAAAGKATRIGPVAYLGPPDIADKLATLVALREDDVRKLPLAARTRWTRTSPLAWDDLETPRDVLATATAAEGISIENPQLVPHDLLAGGKLPPLPTATRLSLLLCQFGLTFRLADSAGQKIRLEPIPERPRLVRLLTAGTKPQDRLKTWAELAPQAGLKVVGRQIEATATAEEIALFEADLKGARPVVGGPKPQGKRFTLKVDRKPLLPVLEVLAKQGGFELRLDRPALEKAKIDLGRPIDLDVRDADLAGLLTALLQGTGLGFRITEGPVVEVYPQP